jgi:hypothetical protein
MNELGLLLDLQPRTSFDPMTNDARDCFPKKKENPVDAVTRRFRSSELKPQGSAQETMEQQQRRYLRPSHVLATQEALDRLAVRVEHAYGLRRPRWWRGCSTQRVWFAAALRLWEVHAQDPLHVPLDAELFVASQPISAAVADPWTELTEPEAARRYRSRVRRIVRQLGSELKREVRRAERLIRRGHAMGAVLNVQDGRLSALGCFIVAQRAGRADLAAHFAAATAAQHRSCPLYRSASLLLMPADFYPIESLALETQSAWAPLAEKIVLSLN